MYWIELNLVKLFYKKKIKPCFRQIWAKIWIFIKYFFESCHFNKFPNKIRLFSSLKILAFITFWAGNSGYYSFWKKHFFFRRGADPHLRDREKHSCIDVAKSKKIAQVWTSLNSACVCVCHNISKVTI